MPSNFRYCGSRVLSTLVGSGVKPQRNPSLALKIALDNIAVKNIEHENN